MNFYFGKKAVNSRGENFELGNVSMRKAKDIRISEIKPLRDGDEILGYFQVLKITNENRDNLEIELTSSSPDDLIKEIR